MMRQAVFAGVNARVREDMTENQELFQQLLANDSEAQEKLGLFRDAPPAKLVIPPTNQQELEVLVDVYLSRRIPENDSFLIAFVNGKYYQSSPKALPNSLKPGSRLAERWFLLKLAEEGEQTVSNPNIGSILYLADPIELKGKRN